MYPIVGSIPVPAGTIRCYSGNFSVSTVAPIGISIHNVATELDDIKYKDIASQVEPTEVVLQTTTTVVRTGTHWEQTLVRLHIGWESDLIDKRKMFYLAEW